MTSKKPVASKRLSTSKSAKDAEPASAQAKLAASEEGGPVLFPLRGKVDVELDAEQAGGDNNELVVEVELASGATDIVAALASNAQAFFAAAASSEGLGSGLAAVLKSYGVVDTVPVYSAQAVEAERRELADLRAMAVTGAVSEADVSARERLPALSQFVRMRFPSGTNSSAIVNQLRKLPEVAKAVRVPRAIPPQRVPQPSDPLIGPPSGALQTNPQGIESQWYLHRTKVLQAWRYAQGKNVVIADIDWGCRTSHSDLKAGVMHTFNAVSGGTDVTQGSWVGHGTGVLGIAGARADANGMAGYAPEATLWVIQADSAAGVQPSFYRDYWAEALDHVRLTAGNDRTKVIILEVQTAKWGNYEQVPVVHRAVRAAIAAGCIVCVAAGNGDKPADRSDDGTPFDPTGSILVGATSYDPLANQRASFSNYGRRVVVSAPGDSAHDVTCASTGDADYRNGFGGTSGATPKVAGVAALMLSVNPNLGHADVREILAATGSSIPSEAGKPIGVFLNAEAAVAEALRRRRVNDVTPGGDPLQFAQQQPIHGISRRRAQMVLPAVTGGPISWDEADELPDPADVISAGTLPASEPVPSSGDKTLRTFRESIEGTLTQEDRNLIVEQAIQMLDNFYVHRPLKEALHAVRPIQRLRVLQRRMQPSARARTADPQDVSELAFHNTITQIFNSVRDLHTIYQLPRPFRDYIAYLPFEVAVFHEGSVRRYLVTRVVQGYTFAHAEFGPGAELITWNGMAIGRAVQANAEQTAGSNDAARHARGVSALTLRPMNTALPPDADTVDLEFVPPNKDWTVEAEHCQMRQSWFVKYAPVTVGGGAAETVAVAPLMAFASPRVTASKRKVAPMHFTSSAVDIARENSAWAGNLIFGDGGPSFEEQVDASPPILASATVSSDMLLASAVGIDSAADAVREARELIFEASAVSQIHKGKAGDAVYGMRGSASPSAAAEFGTGQEFAVTLPWNAAFRARTVAIDDLEYGHIHIRTFSVSDPNGFIAEFTRLLGEMPERGLILDVRGNGGGNIWAAERLLQTLTPSAIDPERMQFIVSGGTLDLCRNNGAQSQIPLAPWLQSLEEGVETGAVYSQAYALTDRESCNAIGQKFRGPVILLVDGNCYSATDMFAAGFQDHRIGKVLGVAHATGAGGANVWEHWLLRQALPSNWGLKPLPNQANMRVAIRQSLRRNGELLEDFGVVPDLVHLPTRDDVLHGDKDLLAFAATVLQEQTVRSIRVDVGAVNKSGMLPLTIHTVNLQRLDFYVNGRPQGTRDLQVAADGTSSVSGLSVVPNVEFRFLGFAQTNDVEAATAYRAVFH